MSEDSARSRTRRGRTGHIPLGVEPDTSRTPFGSTFTGAYLAPARAGADGAPQHVPPIGDRTPRGAAVCGIDHATATGAVNMTGGTACISRPVMPPAAVAFADHGSRGGQSVEILDHARARFCTESPPVEGVSSVAGPPPATACDSGPGEGMEGRESSLGRSSWVAAGTRLGWPCPCGQVKWSHSCGHRPRTGPGLPKYAAAAGNGFDAPVGAVVVGAPGRSRRAGPQEPAEAVPWPITRSASATSGWLVAAPTAGRQAASEGVDLRPVIVRARRFCVPARHRDVLSSGHRSSCRWAGTDVPQQPPGGRGGPLVTTTTARRAPVAVFELRSRARYGCPDVPPGHARRTVAARLRCARSTRPPRPARQDSRPTGCGCARP